MEPEREEKPLIHSSIDTCYTLNLNKKPEKKGQKWWYWYLISEGEKE